MAIFTYKNLIIVTLLALSSISQAQIYKTTTPDGKVIYTDDTTKAFQLSGEKTNNITILDNITNRSQVPTTLPLPSHEITVGYSSNNDVIVVQPVVNKPSFSLSQKGDYHLTITTPAVGMVYRRPAPIVVDVDVKPDLKNSDRIVYFINNKHIATTSEKHYEIPTLDYMPEKYTLTVKIENAKGEIVAEQSQDFQLLQNNVYIQKQRQKAKAEAEAKKAYDNLPWYKKISVNIGL